MTTEPKLCPDIAICDKEGIVVRKKYYDIFCANFNSPTKCWRYEQRREDQTERTPLEWSQQP